MDHTIDRLSSDEGFIERSSTLCSPPSPAPTYTSNFHSQKDSAFSPVHSSSSNPPSPSSSSSSKGPIYIWRDENPRKDEKPCKPRTTLNGRQKRPFILTSPAYTATPRHTYPPPPSSRKTKSRSRIQTILPWIIVAVFLLIALWYTSIALGARVLADMLPQNTAPGTGSINIVINGQEYHSSRPVTISMPGVSNTTQVPSHTHTPIPTSTSTSTSTPPSSDPDRDTTIEGDERPLITATGTGQFSPRNTSGPVPTTLTTVRRRA